MENSVRLLDFNWLSDVTTGIWLISSCDAKIFKVSQLFSFYSQFNDFFKHVTYLLDEAKILVLPFFPQ